MRRLPFAFALLLATLLPSALRAQDHGAEGEHDAAMHHPVTVVIIVRHAEKAAAPANDPPLTEIGEQRAAALVEALKGTNVGAVLHTPTTRTRETARPVAEANGIAMETLPLGPMTTHAAQVAEAVMRHAGKTVVVVGHSNTVMGYVKALGGPERADLCDHQYDGLYTVVIAHGKARLVEGRYGPANPPQTAACAGMMAPASRP